MPALEKEPLYCTKSVIHMGQIPASLVNECTHSLIPAIKIERRKNWILLILIYTSPNQEDDPLKKRSINSVNEQKFGQISKVKAACKKTKIPCCLLPFLHPNPIALFHPVAITTGSNDCSSKQDL